MEQIISTFGLDARLLVIQIINFGVAALILWYFLYRPVVRMLDERRTKIEQSVRDAEEIEHAKSQVDDEKKVILTQANEEASEIVDKARSYASEEEQKLLANAQAKSEGLLSDAQARAEEAYQQRVKESEEQVAQMAVLAAEKILRERNS